jgi:hypothetical protein
MEYEEKGCPHPIVGFGVFCTRCYARVYCSRKCQDIDMLEGKHFLYCKPFEYALHLSPKSPDVPLYEEEEEEEYEQRSGIVSTSKRTLFLNEDDSSSSSSEDGVFKRTKSSSSDQEEEEERDVYPSPDFLKELSLERQREEEDVPESPFFYVSPNMSPYLPGTQPVLSDSE